MSNAAYAGYKGKVKIGDVVIAGIATWGVTGGSRAQLEDSEFGDDHEQFAQGQRSGGDVTISGKYLLDSDEGQQLLLDYYKADGDDTHIDDLQLYFDEDGEKYLEPDPDVSPASYVTVSKEPDYGLEKAGIGTFSVTFKISGMMRPNTTSTEVSVKTVGSMDVLDVSVKLLAQLLCIGEEESVDAYFEYGTTTSYGSNTVAEKTTMVAAGLFDNDVEGLDSSTEYHYRAVIAKSDTSLIAGKDLTFTTAS